MREQTSQWAFCHEVLTDSNNTITLGRDEVGEMQYSAFDSALVLGIMPALLTTGFITNLSFLLVVVRIPHMQTVTNYYLSQLALADIALLVTAVAEKLWYYIASPIQIDKSVFGEAGCVWTEVLKKLFYWASIFLVTLLSFEKLHAIRWPLKHRSAQNNGNRRTLQRILGVWLAAVIISLFCLPSNSRYSSLRINGSLHGLKSTFEIGVCCPINLTLDWVVFVTHCVLFVAFLLANMLMSAGTITAITSRKVLMEQQLNMPAHRLKSSNLIARMLVVNGITFFLLLVPRLCYDLAAVVELDLLQHSQKNIVLNISRILIYLNSVINPVIYVVVNPRYRKAFRRVFWDRSNTVRPHVWT